MGCLALVAYENGVALGMDSTGVVDCNILK